MMNNFRTSSSRFALKIIFVIIFSSFFLPSINNYLIRTNFNYVIKINNQGMSRGQFESALVENFNLIKEQIINQNQKFISNEQNIKIQNQRILNFLINEIILSQYAKKLGINVSNERVKREIFSNPAFQSNGKFNVSLYNSFINKMEITSDQYDQIVRQKLIVQLLINAIVGSDFLLEDEINRLLSLIAQRRFVREASVNIKPFLLKQQVSETEINNHYEQYKNFFIKPEVFRVSYIRLDMSVIKKDSLKVKETEIQSFYDQHRGQFRMPQCSCYSIIQVKTDADAKKVLRKLKSGENFSSIAKVMSIDIFSSKNGGNIGWIEDSILPKELKNSGLKKGEISNAIQSSVGYLIVRLNDVKPVKLKLLNEVRNEIITKIKKEKAKNAYSLLQKKVKHEVVKNTESLACLEKLVGVKAIETNWFNQKNLPKELNFKNISDVIFNKNLINKSDFFHKNFNITVDDNLAFVLHIIGYSPEKLRPITEVRNQIISQIILNKAIQKAKLNLEKSIDEIMKNGKEEKCIIRTMGLTFSSKRVLSRLDSEYNPIFRKVFSLPLPKNGKSSYGFANDAHGNLVLLALDKVESIHISDEQKKLMIQNIIQNNSQMFIESLLTSLRKKAKIEIDSSLVEMITKEKIGNPSV